jgi:hypothetical protein
MIVLSVAESAEILVNDRVDACHISKIMIVRYTFALSFDIDMFVQA